MKSDENNLNNYNKEEPVEETTETPEYDSLCTKEKLERQADKFLEELPPVEVTPITDSIGKVMTTSYKIASMTLNLRRSRTLNRIAYGVNIINNLRKANPTTSTIPLNELLIKPEPMEDPEANTTE